MNQEEHLMRNIDIGMRNDIEKKGIVKTKNGGWVDMGIKKKIGAGRVTKNV